MVLGTHRVGADGEFAVADLLATLVEPSRWDRWRGRGTGWFVLHSVPLGDGTATSAATSTIC
jgi:hypothetical protein